MTKRHLSKQAICTVFLFLLSNLIFGLAPALGQSNIGDGRLFQCSDGLIFSVKTQEQVSAANAKKKMKALIARYSRKISSLPDGSKAISRLLQKRKSARQALKDIKSCTAGSSENPLVGTWNLILENGMSPAENGYNSLILNFSASTFSSHYDGSSFDCLWSGSYSHAQDFSSATLLTTQASGNEFCNQSLDQSQTAIVEFSNDGNQLSLDYTASSGALQVYEKVLN